MEANLEGIKLHIRIAVCKTLDHGSDNIFRPARHKESSAIILQTAS
jgi:hypothetical protein